MNPLIVAIVTQTVVYLLALTCIAVELRKVQHQRRVARSDAIYWYGRFARQCSSEAKEVARALQTGIDMGRDIQAKEDAVRIVIAETSNPETQA